MSFPSSDLMPDVARIEASAPKTSRKHTLLQTIFGGVIGGAGALAAMLWLPNLGWTQALGAGIGFLFGIWVHVIIHEAGHALAGRVMGMRMLAVGVGRWRFERLGNGWQGRRSDTPLPIGGFALVLPQTGTNMSSATLAMFLLGGPMANLLVAAACLVLLKTVALGGLTVGLLLGFGGFGVLIGALNLIPFNVAGFRTDGGGLWDLWRRPQLARAHFGLQQVVMQSMQGLRPRDWDTSVLPKPMETLKALRFPVSALNLSQALDKDDHHAAEAAAAQVWAAAHEDGLSVVQQTYAAIALAGFAAEQRKDLELLRAWRARIGSSMLDVTANTAYLDAALAVLDNAEDASQKIVKATSLLPQVHDEGSRITMQERLRMLTAVLGSASPLDDDGARMEDAVAQPAL